MSYFCPMCANILLTETANDGALRMYCATCPYICPITRPISITLKLERKKVDAVFSDDTFASARTTEVQCPNKGCDSDRASYTMFQTRSADEPSTIFYRCVKCKFRWTE